MVSTRVTSTSCSEARMVRVRSLSTSTSTLAGRLARSSGSAASTASVVRTMLAPGCRLMIRPTPGCSAAEIPSMITGPMNMPAPTEARNWLT
ncbi:hypothetical protein G6F23_015298 [Rhizopus arrhizus]|nr:hypothetical protein G6F23_015298 [Rhizopus arrhizus]